MRNRVLPVNLTGRWSNGAIPSGGPGRGRINLIASARGAFALMESSAHG
ncbi:MAG: hypothetical protein QME76_05225 [Bacillota bacterium]|nr:hypothetical protein [Bacillota bacterium]